MGAEHSHARPPGQPSRALRNRLLFALGITTLIVVAQAVGSLVTGSLALLTDTAHALSDWSGLLVAAIAATMMLRPPSSKRTWGFARIEVVAALGQAALLLVVIALAFALGDITNLSGGAPAGGALVRTEATPPLPASGSASLHLRPAMAAETTMH